MADLKKTFELAFAIGGKLDPSFKSAHSDAAAQIVNLSKKSSEAMAFSKLQKEHTAALNGFKNAASQAGSAWGKVLQSVVGPLSQIATFAGVAGAAVYGLAATTADFGDKAVKTAKKVGLTTKEYSGLAYAAKLSNISQEAFSGSLVKLNKLTADAIKGNKDAQFAFKRAGVTIKDTNGKLKNTKQILLEAADMFATMPEGIYKADLAMALFGKSGADLVPLMEQGSKTISKFGDDANRLGIIFSDVEGERASAFSDSLTEAKAAIQGLGFAIGKQLHEPLTKLNIVFTEWITTNREFIAMKVASAIESLKQHWPDILKYIMAGKDAVVSLAMSINNAAKAVGGWGNVMKGLAIGAILTKVAMFVAALGGAIITTGKLAIATYKLIGVKVALAKASAFMAPVIKGLGATFGIAAIKIILITAAVAAVIAAFVLLEKKFKLFSNMFGAVREFIGNEIQKIKEAFSKGFLTGITTIIVRMATFMPRLLFTMIKSILTSLKGAGPMIVGAWANIWEKVTEFFGGFIENIKGYFSGGLINGILKLIQNFRPGELLISVLGGLATAFNDVIKDTFNIDLLPKVKEIFGPFILGAINIIRGIDTAIVGVITAVVYGIAGLLSKSFVAVREFIVGELNAIKTAFGGGFLKGITSVLLRIPTFFVRMANAVIKSIVGVDLLGVGKQWMGGLVAGITHAGAAVIGAVGDMIGGVLSAVKSVVAVVIRAAGKILSGVAGVISNVWNGVGEIFSRAIENIKSMFENGFLGGIINIIKKLNIVFLLNAIIKKIFDIDLLNIGKTWITQLINGIMAGIKNAATAVKDAIGNLIPKVGDTLRGAVGTVGKVLPKFADGGIATSPSLCAEDGSPEMVIPMTKPTRAAELLRQLYAKMPQLKVGEQNKSVYFRNDNPNATPFERLKQSARTYFGVSEPSPSPLERLRNETKVTTTNNNKSIGGNTFNFSAPITISGASGDVNAIKTSVENALAKMKNEFEQWLAEREHNIGRVAMQ